MSSKKIAITVISIVLVGLIAFSIYFFIIHKKGGNVAIAKDGDTVKIHYTGKLDDGSVFDSSVDSDPLEFTIGAKQVIAGFNNGVIGMKVGEKKTINIPVEDAYGPRQENLVMEVPRSQVPKDINPQAGQQLQLGQPDGRRILVTITQVSESSITLDGNHQLAGKDLTFDLELVEIQ